jgi:hypothetical protein
MDAAPLGKGKTGTRGKMEKGKQMSIDIDKGFRKLEAGRVYSFEHPRMWRKKRRKPRKKRGPNKPKPPVNSPSYPKFEWEM